MYAFKAFLSIRRNHMPKALFFFYENGFISKGQRLVLSQIRPTVIYIKLAI